MTSERTRRRRSRRELVAEVGEGAADVVDRLVGARLLTAERSARDDDSEVELAHEALVKASARLARFLDEERDQLEFVQEVQQAAAVWSRRGRRTSEVWIGAALENALTRVERGTLPLPPTARTFLAEGQREQQRKNRQRSAGVAAVFLALAVIAAVLFVARNRAVEAAAIATRARAVAEREAADAALARGDVWSACAKARTALELDDSVAGRALWRRIEGNALLFKTRLPGSVLYGDFAADGALWVVDVDDRLFGFARDTFLQRDFSVMRDARATLDAMALLGDRALIGARDDGRLGLVDLTNGSVKIIEFPGGGVRDIVAVPARGLFVAAGHDGHVRTVRPDGTVADLFFHEVGVAYLAASADGRRLVGITTDDKLIDTSIEAEEPPPPHPLDADVRDVAVLRDGRVVVCLLDGRVLVLRKDGQVDIAIFVGDSGAAQVAIDPRGGRIAVRAGSGEGTR